jgi:peptide/nickel transport system substrate-binding protein
MSRLRWQLLLVVLALIGIAILLLARQPLLRALVAEPARGGIYIEGLVGRIGRLNPLLESANPADQDINRLLFSGLVRFDDRGNPQPDLAESWGVSLDGHLYNFVLREGLTWHDGQPLTSADIAFTIDLLRNPQVPISEDVRALWETIEVNAFDERHIQFSLPFAFAPFLDYLSFGVLPMHLLGETDPAALLNAPFNLDPIGSGPFRFDQLITEGDEVVGVSLTAWDGYHLGRPFIDQVVFHYYGSSEEAYQAYQQGDVQGISYVDPSILPQVLSDPTINVYTARFPRMSLVMLNLGNASVPFMQEVEVRQALMFGLNRRWIVDRLLEGQALVADSPILPGTWAYNENVSPITFDSDRAIGMLKTAGYTIPAEGGGVRSKEGVSLEFELVHPDDELHTQIAQSIQSNWAEIGVRVNLVAVPYNELVSSYLETGAYEAALIELNFSRSPDPDPYPFWHQAEATGGQNYSKWDDRRASEYLEQARAGFGVSANQGLRARLYRNFQSHFMNELPSLPLFYPVYSYAVSSQIRGISIGPIFSPSDRFATLTEWFVIARGQAEELESTAAPIIEAPTETLDAMEAE